MTLRRFLFIGLPLALAVAIGSCQNDPTGVAPDAQITPDANLVGSLLAPTGLLTCRPLPAATATETIGPAGGTLHVGPHVLTVPRGALDHPVTITGKIVPGNINGVRFSPSGLHFERSARLRMSYANCSLLGRVLPKHIAYVDDDFNILEYLLSFDLLQLRLVTGRVDHFSSYVIAW
jgi:hypothetical protein